MIFTCPKHFVLSTFKFCALLSNNNTTSLKMCWTITKSILIKQKKSNVYFIELHLFKCKRIEIKDKFSDLYNKFYILNMV